MYAEKTSMETWMLPPESSRGGVKGPQLREAETSLNFQGV